MTNPNLRLSLPAPLVQQVAAYLATRPYQEVARMIQGLEQTAQPVEAAAEPSAEDAPAKADKGP